MRFPPPTAAVMLALCISAAPTLALDIDGTHFPDRAQLGEVDLVANGGGLRHRALFKVYAMALYLPAKTGDAEAVLSEPGPKRIAIVPLLDLTAKQFADALRSGIDKNHDNDVVAGLAERLDELAAALETTGAASKGSRIHIDWIPAAGTRLSVGGKRLGQDIAGEDFYHALLRIWLGRKPAQADLRDALLGKTGGGRLPP